MELRPEKRDRTVARFSCRRPWSPHEKASARANRQRHELLSASLRSRQSSINSGESSSALARLAIRDAICLPAADFARGRAGRRRDRRHRHGVLKDTQCHCSRPLSADGWRESGQQDRRRPCHRSARVRSIGRNRADRGPAHGNQRAVRRSQ